MTILKEIRGDTVQVLATDPTDLVEGQIWYNSTVQQFRAAYHLPFTIWTAGGTMATARQKLAGAGTQTAGLAFGGTTPPVTGATEEYNGSAWTAGGTMGTTRYGMGGAGTQTAGLGFNGIVFPGYTHTGVTEEYDGSAWTAGGTMATTRYSLAGAGTQTAGLGFGGYPGPIGGCTEEYDGTSWTAGGSLAQIRYLLSGTGTQTAGLAFGGALPAATSAGLVGTSTSTEEYDGSTWTAGGGLITGKYAATGVGTQTAALAFGFTNSSEEYDGSTWTTGGPMITTRSEMGGAGTQTAGLAFGGSPPVTGATEEYTVSPTGVPASNLFVKKINLS